ncbi:unnamed protein product [Phytomonas sp. EM1]|nr:unnamed protein product [Phytomonas sp. EM1]|eukprot:CCW62926.1 unnamed protein product [Phytomonas sp. isolate EM1]
MFIYGKDQQAFHLERTQAEKWFSRVNIILLAIQLICFISSLVRFGIYSSNIISNSFFFRAQLRINYDILDKDCVFHVKESLGVFRNLEYDVSVKNLGYIIDRNALDLRYLWAVTGLCFFLSVINFVWYEVNAHEVRYHFVVFHKDMITTWQVILLVIGIIFTFPVQRQNKLLDEFYLHCVEIPAGYKIHYSPLAPLFEFYIFYIASFVILAFNGLFAVANLLRKNPRKVFLREEAAQLEMWRKNMQTQGQRPPDMMPSQGMASHDGIAPLAGDHAGTAQSTASLNRLPPHPPSVQHLSSVHEYYGAGEDKSGSLTGTHDGLLYSTNLNINHSGEKHDVPGKNARPSEKIPRMPTAADRSQVESHLLEQPQDPPAHHQLPKDKPPAAHPNREGAAASKAAVPDELCKVLSLYEDQNDVVVEDDKLQDTILRRRSLPTFQSNRDSHDRDIAEGERDLFHNPPSSVPHSPQPQYPASEAGKNSGDGSDMTRTTHERGSIHHG